MSKTKTFLMSLEVSRRIGIILPAENTLEENARLLAEHHAKNILPGHGFFFDFSHVPELKEPVYRYFRETLGWTLDYDGSFLRKPKPQDHMACKVV